MSDARGAAGAGSKGNVTMIASGSRGDVQPQLALGCALERAGWKVRFATHRCFESLVASAALEFFALTGDPRHFLSGATAAQDFRDRERRPDIFQRYMKPFIRTFLRQSLAAAEGADAILYWPPIRVGPPLAEKLGIPCFGVATYPLPHCRTRHFPNPFAEPLSPGLAAAVKWPVLRQWAHLQSWRVEEKVWRGIFESEVAAWRRDVLGLTGEPAFDESRLRECVPHLLGYSAAVLPVPADWPATLHVTGYWFHDLANGWRAPDELCAFMAAGAPPVAIGFGSMVTGDDAATDVVLEAVRRAGVRCILIRGWGGVAKRPQPAQRGDDVYVADNVPHDWLFPQVAGVVHHCGSGTAAAGLRAARPALPVPFGLDQFLWARRLHALGVAPPPIPRAELTAARLAAGLCELVGNAALARRAEALGERIRRENGALKAVEAFETHMRTAPRRASRARVQSAMIGA
ncbi:MAG: glycosyl transferase, family 28 [Betaproteobacteria bacterium]|nr:glycosyl transferase, family 28 [Betaproteobacteria bacterium]